MRRRTVVSSVVLTLAIAGCDTDRVAAPGDKPAAIASPAAPRAGFQVVKASGDVRAAVAQFQSLLGDPANGITPGQQESGRREISWDGVPPELTNTDALPADLFNRNGLIYTIVGSGLRVTDNDFADINPTYADQFAPFSSPKTFAPIGSEVSEVSFRVAGSSTPAAVTGFGVVFSDVDRMGAASIKLFTARGQSLGQYHAPVRSDENGQSFVGVVFDEAIVARVVITSGQAPLGADEFDVSDGGNRDLGVFDNLLYGEPTAFSQTQPPPMVRTIGGGSLRFDEPALTFLRARPHFPPASQYGHEMAPVPAPFARSGVGTPVRPSEHPAKQPQVRSRPTRPRRAPMASGAHQDIHVMRRMPPAARAALLLVVALHAASCGETDPTSAPEVAPPADPSAPVPAVVYSGIPYGPYDLWASTTALKWGPGPFTGSHDNSFLPSSLAQRIAAARQKGMRLVLVLTGGSSEVITNGKFDLGKWKARMDRLNTSAIRKAVADGVADGTIVGNKLIGEPENPKWGGVLTKAMIDQMATYAKNIFPTLPMGIGHGAPGFKWRSGERYKVLDWVVVQYASSYNQGNVTAWRDQVLDFARSNGVRPMFSLNILDGGFMDTTGAWDCPNTGGKGTRTTYCRMTPEQVRTYGRTIGPSGCALLMWRYDAAFMSKAANQSAFKDVSSLLKSKPRPSCRRP